MTLNSSLTDLMNAARDYYQVNQKLTINGLTHLLKPNINLIENSDDFSGDKYTVSSDNSDVTPGSIKYQGLSTYNYASNSGGRGVTYHDNFNPGTYTFSFFMNLDGDPNGERDAFEAQPISHIPFNIQSGWHRYVIPFTVDSSFSSVQVCFWTSVGGSFAGYKLEHGNVATPYLRKDGILVKAPEIILGGGHN